MNPGVVALREGERDLEVIDNLQIEREGQQSARGATCQDDLNWRRASQKARQMLCPRGGCAIVTEVLAGSPLIAEFPYS